MSLSHPSISPVSDSFSIKRSDVINPLLLTPAMGVVLIGYMLIVGSLCLLSDSSGPLVIASILLFIFGWLFVYRDWLLHRKLTLVSGFVGVYSFTYAVRGVYMGWIEDYDILARVLRITPPWHDINVAMWWVSGAMVAFITGGLVAEMRVAKANRKMVVTWMGVHGFRPSISFPVQIMLVGIQLAMLGAIYPLASRGYKMNLTEISGSAYLYLLPTLSHGINLFIVTILVMSGFKWRSLMGIVMGGLAFCVVIVTAYFMANLSSFRGFWLSGIMICGLSAIYIFRGKMYPIILIVLFSLYPMFKQVGMNRGATSSEVIQRIASDPLYAYSAEGIDNAFGGATDMNLFDTFVASNLWDHGHRPYILSVLYTFVHWIPRQLWSSKPEQGCLADTGYTYGAPYSPGIAGFFNDDGGQLYMLFMMFCLGAFIRYLDWRIVLINDKALQACVFAILFLSTLALTRSFVYQVFYASMSFLIPMYAMYFLFGRYNRSRRIT